MPSLSLSRFYDRAKQGVRPAGYDVLKIPIALVLAGVIAFMLFHFLGNALRWPARILVYAGLIGLVWMAFRIVQSIWRQQPLPIFLPAATLFISAGCLLAEAVLDRDTLLHDFYAVFPFPNSTPAVDHLLSLNNELKKRGAELTVVAMPYRQHLSKTDDSTLIHRFETRAARKGMARLSQSGIACVDLWNIYEDKAYAADFWDPDHFHITEKSQEIIAAEIASKLGRDARFQDSEGSLIMGECFARQFGANLRRHHEGWADLKILFANGDRGKIANSLFLFPDQYLKGTKRVYWLMSYQLLATDTFTKVEPNPSHDSDEREVAVELKEGLGWKNKTHGAQLKDMPYENGLVELLCETKDGEPLLLIGYGVRERSVKALGSLRKGHRIIATVIPYDAHIREFPKAASEYVVHPTEDFEAPRMWIKEWVREY